MTIFAGVSLSVAKRIISIFCLIKDYSFIFKIMNCEKMFLQNFLKIGTKLADYKANLMS
ncbi:MAG: hypothetical protein IJV56_06590 [Neisseriaceae bacterium]|nr:hypothetical protein [Neisseriaceae bacterium]MBQ9724989.1 hypothetical protein [Neisseriaceae bacterium]